MPRLARTRSLCTRLIVSLATVAFGTAVSIAILGELAAANMVDTLLADQGHAVVDGTLGRVRDRQRAKEVFAQLLASDPAIIEAVSTGDEQAVGTVLVPLRTRLGLSRVTVFEIDGAVLLSLSPQPVPVDASLVDDARAGLLASRAVVTPEGLLIEAIAPVKNEAGIIGAISVGVLLDDAALGELTANDDHHLVVVADDRVAASTRPIPITYEPLGGAITDSHREVDIGGVEHAEIAHQIDGGTLLVLTPTADLQGAQAGQRARLTIGSLIIALIGGLAGVYQARRLSSPIDSVATAATRIGAGDYDHRIEPCGIDEIDRLGQAVNQLSTDVQDQMHALTHQALHDPLTGLANRALFADRLDHALQRRDSEVSVLFIDIDDFKDINDTLGHNTGDALLIELSQRLSALVRGQDTAARLGGDEFGILLEDPSLTAQIVAERVLEGLTEPFTTDDNTEITITASIGIAIGFSGVEDAEAVLRNADTAMYVAKNDGKNRWVVFETAMHLDLVQRIQLKSDLANAIDNNELHLEYQPIVSFPSLEQCGTEALLRWDHPTHGRIPPDIFIPLAEESGLIVPIGRWVLQEACNEAIGWQQPDQPIGLSVNVSARQFHDHSLMDHVSTALANSGLDPRLLTIEITETALMNDVTAGARTIQDLKALGVRVSLDDFGTGYSSLNYLQQFHVDEIKIDRSFTDRLSQPGADPSLLHSVIQMAQALSADTVAEGIEDPHQLETLNNIGVTMGQGFYLARPSPPPASYTRPTPTTIQPGTSRGI